MNKDTGIEPTPEQLDEMVAAIMAYDGLGEPPEMTYTLASYMGTAKLQEVIRIRTEMIKEFGRMQSSNQAEPPGPKLNWPDRQVAEQELIGAAATKVEAGGTKPDGREVRLIRWFRYRNADADLPFSMAELKCLMAGILVCRTTDCIMAGNDRNRLKGLCDDLMTLINEKCDFFQKPHTQDYEVRLDADLQDKSATAEDPEDFAVIDVVIFKNGVPV